MVYAAQDRLDAYVLQLGRDGVALRGLELEVTPLESLFFQLTGDAAPPGPPPAIKEATMTLAAGRWPAYAAPAAGRAAPRRAGGLAAGAG